MRNTRVSLLAAVAAVTVLGASAGADEILLSPTSQPATRPARTQPAQVPIETIRRMFDQTLKQAQMAEAGDDQKDVQRAIALYRKAQGLATSRPELKVDQATLSRISDRLNELPRRLAHLKEEAARAEAAKKEAQLQQAIERQRNLDNAARRQNPGMVVPAQSNRTSSSDDSQSSTAKKKKGQR